MTEQAKPAVVTVKGKDLIEWWEEKNREGVGVRVYHNQEAFIMKRPYEIREGVTGLTICDPFLAPVGTLRIEAEEEVTMWILTRRLKKKTAAA